MNTRAQLLQKSLPYFLQHGVANLSLRPMADALGTSARMLLHHFGSKERLIGAVMTEVRAALQASFATLMAQLRDAPPAELVLAFWNTLTSKSELPSVRLLFEVQVLAIQNPRRYQRYLSETSSSWLLLLEPAFPARPGRRVLATLSTAVIDGLLLELLSTGDLRRTSAALQVFIGQLERDGKKSRAANE
jgi:AcrR family transcriptional regulator